MGQHISPTIRVLLVDDHRIVRQALHHLLEQEFDFDIVGEAGNGAEGVNLADVLRPDIILMDAQMPVLNGVEATRRIHDAHPEIVVIGLSMHEHIEGIMSEAGAVAQVNKSVLPDQLVTLIRTWYERTHQRPAQAA